MQDLDGIKKLLKESSLLDLDDDRLCAEFEEYLSASEERDRQISEVLEKMLAEVEELIDLAEELESDDSFCG